MLPVVTRLRDFRTYGHPLLLIAVWSMLEAATIIWIALLPGHPTYNESGGVGSLGQAIFFTALFVLFVALGSRFVWWLAIFSSILAVGVAVAAGVFELGVKPLGVAALQTAALWLLWSGNIEMYVQSHRRTRRVTAPPAR